MCGVVGIYGHAEAANLAYLGLHALQHRGQESAGIVSTDGEKLRWVREMGHVGDIFTADRLAHLSGFAAIGHVRYSTAGDSTLKNAQPIAVDYAGGSVAVGHNGNLVNAVELRERLESEGSIFQTTSDTEVIVHLIAKSREQDLPGRAADALRQVRGAYSLVFLSEDTLVAVRDPMGFRPLALGKARAKDSEVWVVSSETCAFELIGAEYVRDLEPGEMVIITESGVRSVRPFGAQPAHRCVFEWIYFARPDSTIDGRSVYRARERMGRRLAIEHAVDADVVIPVPDSGMAAAIGYARESGIPYDQGLMRSHFMGRTFIEPSQQIRHFGVKLKLSPVREVHLRISSPPTVGPCRYGIDTPTSEELIGANHSVEQIRDFIGADSLGYLSLEGLYQSVEGWRHEGVTDGARKGGLPVLQSGPASGEGFCDACFSGRYPIADEQPARLRQLRLISA